jgi:RloB-like protein
MGQRTKFTDQKKEWFLRRTQHKNRILEARKERDRFLIVCEGEKTEPHYFEAFGDELPLHVVYLKIVGEGSNTIDLVETAINMRDEYADGDYPFDYVWVVFDRDSFQPDNFDNAIHMAQAAEIKCAWSNEAFELWFVLHFQYRNTAMSRDEYKGKLTEILDRPYKKNAEDMYLILSKRGDQAQAIAWAKSLFDDFSGRGIPPSRSNPCTTVYLLVEKLNEYKTPENA